MRVLFLIYASNESKFVLARDLATVAIIKIDPLDQLLICNATSKIHKAYFISLLQKDNNRTYAVINYRYAMQRVKFARVRKYTPCFE